MAGIVLGGLQQQQQGAGLRIVSLTAAIGGGGTVTKVAADFGLTKIHALMAVSPAETGALITDSFFDGTTVSVSGANKSVTMIVLGR